MIDDKQQIAGWLLCWFRKQRLEIVQRSDEELLRADYFAAEFIDSLGVVELIGDAEAKFGIRFDESDFQDRRFSTVEGLANIIRERVDATR